MFGAVRGSGQAGYQDLSSPPPDLSSSPPTSSTRRPGPHSQFIPLEDFSSPFTSSSSPGPHPDSHLHRSFGAARSSTAYDPFAEPLAIEQDRELLRLRDYSNPAYEYRSNGSGTSSVSSFTDSEDERETTAEEQFARSRSALGVAPSQRGNVVSMSESVNRLGIGIAGEVLEGGRRQEGDRIYSSTSHSIKRKPTMLSTTRPLPSSPSSSPTPHEIESEYESLIASRRNQLAQWGIHLLTPALALALYLLGVASAFAHHFYYLSLVDQPAVDQLTKIRYGTALAFFTKACLVGSVVVSYKQRIWYTMRQKALRLRSLDSLFGMVEDPSMFFNLEIYRFAKVATIMALATWLIPIAAVLSPATLTSKNLSKHRTSVLPVPTLNFTKENFENYRRPRAYPGYQLSFVNTTTTGHPSLDFEEFDWYDQPSKQADKIAMLSILSKSAITEKEGEKPCWNCTYTITFEAPSYKCTKYDETGPGPRKLPPYTPKDMNWTALVPTGDFLYMSNVDLGDYLRPQDESDPDKPPGTFLTEPDLWLAYAVNLTTLRDPLSDRYDLWNHDFSRHILHCRHYAAELTVKVQIINGQEHYRVLNRRFLAPLLFNPLSEPADESAGEKTSRFTTPMMPTMDSYNIYTGYHSLAKKFRAYLRGTIFQLSRKEMPVTTSDINMTGLVDQKNSQPLPDLKQAVVQMYENITFSLLSEPKLVVAETVRTKVDIHEFVFVFSYSPRNLWAGYALVILLAFIFLLIGFHAMYSNGVASDTCFSRVVVTTRNRTIDRLAVGACLGGDPFPAELAEVKLRFGVLAGRDNPGLQKSNYDKKDLKYSKSTGSDQTIIDDPFVDRGATSPPLSGNSLANEGRQWGTLDVGSGGVGEEGKGKGWDEGDLRGREEEGGRLTGHCAFGTEKETYLIQRGHAYQ